MQAGSVIPFITFSLYSLVMSKWIIVWVSWKTESKIEIYQKITAQIHLKYDIPLVFNGEKKINWSICGNNERVIGHHTNIS